MQNLSYENEFDLHLNGLVTIPLLHDYERFRTWTHFKTEAKGTRKWPIYKYNEKAKEFVLLESIKVTNSRN